MTTAMQGMIGRKVGMTVLFDKEGGQVPCTVLEIGPNIVVQVKRADGKDGYNAVQLGFGTRRRKRTTKAMAGHFASASVGPVQVLTEFRCAEPEMTVGQELRAEQVFSAGDTVDVAATSKGKGFQGVVRRHGFRGVNDRTHGQHNRERAPGSIGAASDPSRVMKGMRMGGRMGGRRVTIKNLAVARVIAEHNLVLVRGAVPGANKCIVKISKRT